jgi:uncharacterized protein
MAAAGNPPEKDQSMDDILASIRRIMLDEQARLQDTPGGASSQPPARSPDPNTETVLILDSSMSVEDMPAQSFAVSLEDEKVTLVPTENTEVSPAPPAAEKTPDPGHATVTATVPADAGTAEVAAPLGREPETSPQTTVLGATGTVPVILDAASHQVLTPQAIEALMAPAAAAAAAASVEVLIKQLSEERLAALQPARSGSPSLEDVVRAELRPFLKAWLDEHLPPMVERLVRAEISRLIGRSGF